MYKKQEQYQLSVRQSKWPFYILTALLLLIITLMGAKGLFTHDTQQILKGGNKLQVKCFTNNLQVAPVNTTKVKVSCVSPKTASRTSTNESQSLSQTTNNNPEPPPTNLTATIPTAIPPSGNQGIWISAAELAHLSKSKAAAKRRNRIRNLKTGTLILLHNPDKAGGKPARHYPIATIPPADEPEAPNPVSEP